VRLLDRPQTLSSIVRMMVICTVSTMLIVDQRLNSLVVPL
jgi:hypothetical protein